MSKSRNREQRLQMVVFPDTVVLHHRFDPMRGTYRPVFSTGRTATSPPRQVRTSTCPSASGRNHCPTVEHRTSGRQPATTSLRIRSALHTLLPMSEHVVIVSLFLRDTYENLRRWIVSIVRG